MLKKRVIFTLLYDDRSFMLSRNFNLQKVGDLYWLKKNYNFSHIAFSIDELIILDVTRGPADKNIFYEYVRALSKECFVPIAVGGGVRTLEDARNLFRCGADKIVLNALLSNDFHNVIEDISKEFGRQSIVASIDIKNSGDFSVWTHNGSLKKKESLREWLGSVVKLPIGEIYLNSIDRDGTGHGLDHEIINQIPNDISLPIIFSGGVGKVGHLAKGLDDNRIDAIATANLFNFIGDGLEKSRIELLHNGYNLADWDIDKAKGLNGFFK